MFCRSQGKHGGSAIYVHKDINFKPNLKIEKLSKSGVCEMTAVEGNLGKADAVIVSVYRPPSINIDDFLEAHTLTELFHEKRTLFVVGDFNIELQMENKAKDQLLSLMSSLIYHKRCSKRLECLVIALVVLITYSQIKSMYPCMFLRISCQTIAHNKLQLKLTL